MLRPVRVRALRAHAKSMSDGFKAGVKEHAWELVVSAVCSHVARRFPVPARGADTRNASVGGGAAAVSRGSAAPQRRSPRSGDLRRAAYRLCAMHGLGVRRQVRWHSSSRSVPEQQSASKTTNVITRRLTSVYEALLYSLLVFIAIIGLLVVSWPLMDLFLIPWSIRSRMLSAIPRAVATDDAVLKAAEQLRAHLKSRKRGETNVVCVVADDAMFAERVVRHMQEAEKEQGRPCLHFAHLGMGCPAQLLYGCLYETYSAASVVVAYVKFLNAAGLALTMNQNYEYLTSILFNQFIGQVRMALGQGAPSASPYLSVSHADFIIDSANSSSPVTSTLRTYIMTITSIFTSSTATPCNATFIVTGDAQRLLAPAKSTAQKGTSKDEAKSVASRAEAPYLFENTELGRILPTCSNVEVLHLQSDAGHESVQDESLFREEKVRSRYQALLLEQDPSRAAAMRAVVHAFDPRPGDGGLRARTAPLRRSYEEVLGSVLSSGVLSKGVAVAEAKQALETLLDTGCLQRVAGAEWDEERRAFVDFGTCDVEFCRAPGV